MQEFQIDRDNGASLIFNGELLAKVSSSDNNASGSSYSGETGRSQVLSLYRTEKGRYICQKINRTCWQGERDSRTAIVCDDHKQIIEFFGYGWLAKDLYYEVGINAAVRVD